MTEGRNTKGSNGSVKIEILPKGDRQIDFDGLRFQVGAKVAEELLSALSSSLRPYAGYSIFDKIMVKLDSVLDRMMAGEPQEDGRDPGRAEALTLALAIIRNPYEPNYTEEKERQMERYHERNPE